MTMDIITEKDQNPISIRISDKKLKDHIISDYAKILRLVEGNLQNENIIWIQYAKGYGSRNAHLIPTMVGVELTDFANKVELMSSHIEDNLKHVKLEYTEDLSFVDNVLTEVNEDWIKLRVLIAYTYIYNTNNNWAEFELGMMIATLSKELVYTKS